MKKSNKNTTTNAEEKKIIALYNEKTVRVYQAFNHKIADEALRLGRFLAYHLLDIYRGIHGDYL